MADQGAWLAQSSQANVQIGWLGSVNSTVEAAPDEMGPDAIITLHETQGKRTQTKLSFFRNIDKAWRIDGTGKKYTELETENGTTAITVRPFEYCRVALRWSSS